MSATDLDPVAATRRLAVALLLAVAVGAAGMARADAEAEDVSTVAEGPLARAETLIGSVEEDAVTLGNVESETTHGEVVTRASGLLSEACASFGSVGGC
jgi:hypothetical protein